MASNEYFQISKLSLDLKNFRTVPQKKEADAIHAMITIKPERFHAIMESIMEDGYIPTENIIVLKQGKNHIVKEGNRRIAALKLIHGLYKLEDFAIPKAIIDNIALLDKNWKKDNLKVPCTIYESSEAAQADKVVALSHGKGEKASRDPWSSVATARHNRDAKKMQEPALDLLEKYLTEGNNLNNQQKDRWAGDYPLSILHEALRFTHQRLGYATVNDLVVKYPKIKNVSGFEDMLRDIGLEQISFKLIRDTTVDFALKYGITPTVTTPASASNQAQAQQNSNAATATTNSSQSSHSTQSTAKKSVAMNDPKYVAELLRKFTPTGTNRQKVVTLRDELKKLKISDTPIAFCFVLRSLFEISAKAYCTDHSISLTHPSKNGKPPVEKKLIEVLNDVTNHLTTNKTNKPLTKTLHGALTELGKPVGILSITSMNNLVHNPGFSVQPPDICTLFGNIYPLLESMN